MKILGAWYSHNGAHRVILSHSQESIDKAAWEMPNVYIITCVWDEIPYTRFHEIIAEQRKPNHLGIALQILQCFDEAEKTGLTPDVICFLEHDVLYPDHYFQEVADAFKQHPEAVGVNHQNYIGMNETGWLEVIQRQDPMHQLSMRYPDARRHIEAVIKGCETSPTGWCALEPPNVRTFLELPADPTKQPSVHINHRSNFTSHCNTFERTAQRQIHPFWGDFRDYYPQSEHQMRA